MSRSHDDSRGSKTDPRFDNFPIERRGGYTDWPVERATSREDHLEEAEAPELVGFTPGSALVPVPYVYDPDRDDIVAGELDRENERILVADRAVETGEESADLSDRVAEVAEEHDMTWLSSFAREHLGAEPEPQSRAEPADTTFERSSLPESSPADVGFFASHTFDDDGHVYVLERDLDVERSDEDVTVTVEATLLSVDDDEDGTGDADVLDQRSYRFPIDVEAPSTRWRAAAEEELQEWHEEHVGIVGLD